MSTTSGERGCNVAGPHIEVDIGREQLPFVGVTHVGDKSPVTQTTMDVMHEAERAEIAEILTNPRPTLSCPQSEWVMSSQRQPHERIDSHVAVHGTNALRWRLNAIASRDCAGTRGEDFHAIRQRSRQWKLVEHDGNHCQHHHHVPALHPEADLRKKAEECRAGPVPAAMIWCSKEAIPSSTRDCQ